MQRRRRASSPSGLLEVIGDLIDAPEPVSFYDALALVRQIRAPDPHDKIVRALMLLHDVDHATDGARAVLSDYLGACARRQANQRALGERAIVLKDNGKTVRLRVGSRLQLRLDERRTRGFRWEVTEHIGGGTIKRDKQTIEDPGLAVFEVNVTRTGVVELTLIEEPPAAGAPGEDDKERRFVLTIIVDRG